MNEPARMCQRCGENPAPHESLVCAKCVARQLRYGDDVTCGWAEHQATRDVNPSAFDDQKPVNDDS